MKKIRENKELQEAIDNLKSNPYCEVIHVSDVELLDNRIKCIEDLVYGDYPIYVKFTAMQKVEVTYKNQNKIKKDIIVAGFDAVRYRECRNGMYEGEYLDDCIITVDFLGEWTKTIDTVLCD